MWRDGFGNGLAFYERRNCYREIIGDESRHRIRSLWLTVASWEGSLPGRAEYSHQYLA